MDYAEPPTPIDGLYHALFSVRDLASGKQLAWLPVPAATAEHAAAALEALFLEHGPPLVLKCDNGAPFIAERTQDLLAAQGVVVLFSPPYTPRYNGACEAGIGGLKARSHHLAARPNSTQLYGDRAAGRRKTSRRRAGWPMKYNTPADSAASPPTKSGTAALRSPQKNDVAAATSSNFIVVSNVL